MQLSVLDTSNQVCASDFLQEQTLCRFESYLWKECSTNRAFIHSVFRHVHRIFQSDFSRECDTVPLLSNSNNFYFSKFH
jgi:hypothetical protein